MTQLSTDLGFVHEALLYAGEEEFVAGTVPFIAGGVAAGEAVMVAVAGPKIDLLRGALGTTDESVVFVDMDEIGGNPARIIPAWHDFLATRPAGAGPVRGVGEPIGPSRNRPALLECQRHEALLNLAFADSPAWWLLCPYDVAALEPAVVEEAARSHPYLMHAGKRRASDNYTGAGPVALAEPFAEPRTPADRLVFGEGMLGRVRQFVIDAAGRRGLGPARMGDLLLAVNELATNSIRHGGGRGSMRVWSQGDAVVCEVTDRGRLTDPLVGRRRPDREAEGGRGLWIVNQLCDLVELRSTPHGTAIRVHKSK